MHGVWVQDAKVMSWWDYGYQITAMANRTILVDNNTWNNTHISRVGQVGACPVSARRPRGSTWHDSRCVPFRQWHRRRRKPTRS